MLDGINMGKANVVLSYDPHCFVHNQHDHAGPDPFRCRLCLMRKDGWIHGTSWRYR